VLLIVFGIGGAAVDTPKIATVGDRNSEIGDLAAEFILQRHFRSPEKQKARFSIGIGRTPETGIFPV
jgi:hypothetical protein